MPPKRKTRTASRCKPVLANITNKLNVIDSKEKQRRAFLIDDFRRNVALRMEMLQEEERQLEASLWKSYEIYRQQLLPWQNVTVQELLQYSDVDSIPKPAPQASKRDKKIPESTGQNTAASGLRGDEVGELPTIATEEAGITSSPTAQNTLSAIPSGVETDAKDSATEVEATQSASSTDDGQKNTEESTQKNTEASTQENTEESTQEKNTSTQESDPPGVFAVPQSVAPKAARMSDISALLAETSKFTASKPKKKKATNQRTPAVPLSATRSSSRLRRGDGASAHMAPPTSGRPRAKYGESGMLVTPAGQRVPTKLGSQLLVTPKFDPRLPLPPNTQLRRPLPREVPMSITGSPLRLSPDKPKLKAIMGEFLETLEREVPSLDHKDIRQFQSVLQRHLDTKP